MKKIPLFLTISFVLAACVPGAITPAPTIPPTSLPSIQPPGGMTPMPSPSATATTPETKATPTPLPEAQTISPANAANLQLTSRLGTGRVISAVWSPDDKHLAIITTLGLIYYDAFDQKAHWQVNTETMQIEGGISDDGKVLTTIDQGGAATRWDTADGKMIGTPLPQQKNAMYISLSAHGDYLAATDANQETAIIETTGGQVIGHNTGLDFPRVRGEWELWSMSLSPNGERMVIVGNRWLDKWNPNVLTIEEVEVKTGNLLRTLAGHYMNVYDLKYAPSGTMVGGEGKRQNTSTLKISSALFFWGAENISLQRSMFFNKEISAWAFLANGKSAVMAFSDGSIEHRGIVAGIKSTKFEGNTSSIFKLLPSPNARWLASIGYDGALKMWDFTTNKLVGEVKTSEEPALVNSLLSMALSPDGSQIALSTGYLPGIKLLELSNTQVTMEFGDEGKFYSTFAWSPDGKLLACVRDLKIIDIFNVATGEKITEIDTKAADALRELEFSRDGKQLASVGGNILGELYLWDPQTGKKLHTLSGYNRVAFSPDGKTLASFNVDFQICTYDINTGKRITCIPSEYVYDLSYSPDGKLLAATGWIVRGYIFAHVDVVYLVDTNTMKKIPVKMEGFPKEGTGVIFSPDGSLLASNDGYGNLYIWETATGKLLKQFPSAAMDPVSLNFRPDQKTLLVGSGDGQIQFYSVK